MTLLNTVVLVAVLAQAKPAPPPPPAAQQEKKPAPSAQATKPADPAQPGKPATGKPGASDALALQVALDRAGFSAGAIDGRAGSNTKKALEAYRKQNGGDPPAVEATTRCQITAQDTAGPFEAQIPRELPDQAKLPALSYTSVEEALAERFHSTPEFLKKLNPGARFAAGEEIVVPNVEPMQPPTETTETSKPARGAKPSAPGKPATNKPAAGSKPDAPRGTAGQQPQGQPGQPNTSAPAEVVVTVSKSA